MLGEPLRVTTGRQDGFLWVNVLLGWYDKDEPAMEKLNCSEKKGSFSVFSLLCVGVFRCECEVCK